MEQAMTDTIMLAGGMLLLAIGAGQFGLGEWEWGTLLTLTGAAGASIGIGGLAR
jgi:hypothetical protein